jgi:energy-coupling factor transporter ATP-binding protein EcfA2
MPDPNAYPSNYREREINALLSAVRSGECAAVLGLSGAGKSNVLRHLAQAHSGEAHPLVLVDANRLKSPTSEALFDQIGRALGEAAPGADHVAALEGLLERRLRASGSSLTLLLDRFDALTHSNDPALFGNLRVLRDAHKYRLTLIIAARHPLEANNELAELFFANTFWLGPLSDTDARWTIARYTARKGLTWDEAAVQKLIELTRGYASFLRAACEAYAGGAPLTVDGLRAHPAMHARLAEFWADRPSEAELRQCGLTGLLLLMTGRPAGLPQFDTTRLTAKENLLLEYFLAHPNAVCAKDDLIRAVWPEDKVFTQGVRDDSLAQIVRRLREKIEPDAAHPRYIQTAPGRGYRFTP